MAAYFNMFVMTDGKKYPVLLHSSWGFVMGAADEQPDSLSIGQVGHAIEYLNISLSKPYTSRYVVERATPAFIHRPTKPATIGDRVKLSTHYLSRVDEYDIHGLRAYRGNITEITKDNMLKVAWGEETTEVKGHTGTFHWRDLQHTDD